jgi:hypothetical protein
VPSSPGETPWERRHAAGTTPPPTTEASFVTAATRPGPRLTWAQPPSATRPSTTGPTATAPDSAIWSPVAVAPVTSHPRAPVGVHDARLLAILTAPAAPDETALVAFARKERELTAVLVALPATEAIALHRRLTVAAADDALVTAFGRLVIERRQRLLGVLADARRREAMARCRAA